MPKWKKSVAKEPHLFMQPLQCDLRLSDAKHKSTMLATAAARNLDAAIPLRSADTELQNTKAVRATAPQIAAICSSKTGSRRQSGKTTILKHFLKGIFKGKSSMPNWKKVAAKAPFATVMCSCSSEETWCNHSAAICGHWLPTRGAKRNRIATQCCRTHRLDAAVPMHKAYTELQSAIELQRATVEHIARMQQFHCTKCFNTCKTQ